MTKIFVASFNRASDEYLTKLIYRLKKHHLYTDNYKDADYILAIGDRVETYEFVLKRFQENMKIIHYGAGEISQGCHDEVYRHSITLMSMMQLCSNRTAMKRVKKLCKSVDKKSNVYIVGNLPLDNFIINESIVPKIPYNVVLYNPPTLLNRDEIRKELDSINLILQNNKNETIWIEPNGDINSDLIFKYITHKTFPRPQFLGLLKHCKLFITNSSCQFYEAPFVMKDKSRIISIGIRNQNRESKYSKMDILNASDKIIKILETL
jgi:UDP-N-acetylglucosamine 2-epimerase